MTAIAAPAWTTTEDLLALPENGIERWLIRGRLREKARVHRNRWHGRAMVRISYLLVKWLEQQPEPRGAVLGGEAGCRLRRNPDTTVGIDVVYISAALAVQGPDDTTLIDGVPTLVVEILSPNDTEEEINEKIDEYLRAGVPLVWIVDTHFQTVKVHRPDREPELFNVTQELSADPHLPGLQIPVARIFQR
jgi:Uma2 family endonuclease